MVGVSGIFVQLATTGLSIFFINGFSTSQTIGIITAMTSNYFLNNYITFQERRLKSIAFFQGLLSFYLICSWVLLQILQLLLTCLAYHQIG